MTETGKVHNLTEKQLRALYDPIRIRISHLLKTPRTPKQVADIINVRPNNLYYHFKVLEKAGIIKHIETRPGKGFIKENYFQLTSPDFVIAPEMVPLDTTLGFFQNLIRAAMEDLGESLDKHNDIHAVGVRDDYVFPEERLKEVRDLLHVRIRKVVEELKTFEDNDGDCDYQLNFFAFRL